MTRDEFVTKWRDEIGGILYDALTESRSGSVAYIWLRHRARKVDQILSQMYAELTKPAPVNGQPTKEKANEQRTER